MKSVLLVSVLIGAAAAPALADDSAECTKKSRCSLEGQSDVAFDIGVSEHLVPRSITRMVRGELNRENRGETHLGLGIRDGAFSFDLTAGYAYSHGGPTPGNALVIGMWKQ